MILDNQK